MTGERRRETRVSYATEVTEYGDKERKWKAGNLSEGGIFLETMTPLPTGTVIEIGFYLPGYDVEVLAEAMVEWTNVPDSPTYDAKRDNGMGLMFLDIDPAQDRVLQAFVNKERWNEPTEDDDLEALLDSTVGQLHEPAAGSSHDDAAKARAKETPGTTPAVRAETVDPLLADLQAPASGAIALPARQSGASATKRKSRPGHSAHDALTAPVRTSGRSNEREAVGKGRPKPGQKAAVTPATAAEGAAASRYAPPKPSKGPVAHSAAIAEALAKAKGTKAGREGARRPKAGARAATASSAAESRGKPPSATGATGTEPGQKATEPVRLVSPETPASDTTEPEVAAAVAQSVDAVTRSAPALAKANSQVAVHVPAPPPAPPPDAEIVLDLEESLAESGTVASVELTPEPLRAGEVELTPELIPESESLVVAPIPQKTITAPIPIPVVGPETAAAFSLEKRARVDAVAATAQLDNVAHPAPDTAAQQLFADPGQSRSPESAVDPYLAERLPIGSVLGSYRIESWLGSGGMGDVYLAEHVSLGRRVALKRLRSAFVDNQRALKRFFDEARAVNQIHHENIVEVTDFVAETAHTYHIMEYLDGPSLAELQTRGRGLPMTQALHVAIQVCGALDAVHSAGIIHRDLKPQNIMLIQRGADRDFVKLLDFGVAKLKDPEATQALTGGAGGGGGQTTGSMLLGTPGYMAPEQLLGQTIDHRADIYALGVILYQMTTGTNPFVADTWGQAVVKHVTELPPPLTNYDAVMGGHLPADLEALILQCLAKKPEERPETVGEVGRRLRDIVQAIAAGGELEVASGKKKRRVGRWVAVATTVSVIAAAGAWVGIEGPKESVRLAEVTFARVRGLVADKPASANGQAPVPSAGEAVAAVAAPAPAPAPSPAATPAPAVAPALEPIAEVAAADAGEPEQAGGRRNRAGRSRSRGRTRTAAEAKPEPVAAPVAAAAPPPKQAPAPLPPKPKPAPAAAPPPAPRATPVAAAPAAESPADALYAEGKSLLKANKALLAVDAFKKAIAANPRHIKSYRMLGKAYVMLGREQKAIEAFEKFVKLAPNHKDAEKMRQIIAAYRSR